MIERVKRMLFFETKTIRETIFKNFFWLLAGNVGSRLFKALIIIYAARKLGVEGYGIFSYALGLAGFFVFFKNIGVDSILTREVAKQPEKQHYYFSTSFWIEIVLLIITAFFIIFIAPLFSGIEAAIVLLPLIALIFIFDDLRDLFVAFFRGKEKMELEALITATVNISLVVFGFVALFYWSTPKAFIISNVLASFLGIIVAVFLLKPFVRGIIKNFTKNLVAPILKSAWPFAVAGFTGIFLFNVDIVMLGWWRTAEEIGLYSAAQRIVGILAIFSGFISITTLPTLSRFAHSDKQKMGYLLESALKIIFIVAFPLLIGGFILKDYLINFIFGSNYLPAANAFAILLFSILAIHPLPILSNLFFVFDKQAKIIKYTVISSLCNIVLNFILIPKYGIEGAAIATLISFFVYIIFLWRAGKKIYKFHIISGLLKPIAAAIIMGFLVYALKSMGIHIIINIVVSSVFYFTCLYLLKEKMLGEIFLIFKNR